MQKCILTLYQTFPCSFPEALPGVPGEDCAAGRQLCCPALSKVTGDSPGGRDTVCGCPVQWAWPEADFGWFLPSVQHFRGGFGGKMGVTAGYNDPCIGVSSAKRLMETTLTGSLPACLHMGLGTAAVQPLAPLQGTGHSPVPGALFPCQLP